MDDLPEYQRPRCRSVLARHGIVYAVGLTQRSQCLMHPWGFWAGSVLGNGRKRHWREFDAMCPYLHEIDDDGL